MIHGVLGIERIASHRRELAQGLIHILPVVKTPNILYKRQEHGQTSPKTLRHLNQVSGKTMLTEVIHRSIQPSMTLCARVAPAIMHAT